MYFLPKVPFDAEYGYGHSALQVRPCPFPFLFLSILFPPPQSGEAALPAFLCE